MDWQPTAGARWANAPVPAAGHAGFARQALDRIGITFTNRLALERYVTNQIYLNGAGVALGDVDQDGWCDVFLCGLDNHNTLYRNLGEWKFEDITEAAGVGCAQLHGCTGAALVDLDGDGDLDLLVNTIGEGTHLFLNDGQGHFTESNPQAAINPGRGGMTLALADIDGDGWLDLYVANYRTETIRDHPQTQMQGDHINGKPVVLRVNGRPTTEPDLIGRFELTDQGRIIEHGEPDALFRNLGGGRLAAVEFVGGAFLDEDGKPLAAPPYDWGLSAMFRDLDGEGTPDLYVCNDFESPDRIWLNDGHGRFRALPRLALRHTSLFSMGVDFGDLNRDGYDDIVVSDMLMQDRASQHLRLGDIPPVFLLVGAIEDRPQYSFNTLQLNRGDGTYAEVAWYADAPASGWTWCPVLLDVDLDGYEDVLFPTGHQHDMMNADVIDRAEVLKAQRKMSKMEQLYLRTNFMHFNTPNVAFRNRGNLTFEDRSAAWGFTAGEVSQGIALGDLDNDGDLDVVVNNLNAGVGVYRNESVAPRVGARLRGAPPNTRGIGAKLRLLAGAVPLQSQEMICGGRFLSCDDAMRVFAAGTLTNVMRLEVTWRNGRRSVLEGVQANRIYEVDEDQSVPAGQPGIANRKSQIANRASALRTPHSELLSAPWFEEVTGFTHTHHEAPFDDLARQPLLFHKLSQLGPGVCWYDVDDDGWDDLIIGSGRGGALAVYRNDGRGGFTALTEAFITRPVARDQTTVLAAEGVLLTGSSNYEDGLTNGGCLRLYDLRRKVAGDSILGQQSSVGPLATADVDADADLDLFVGGRSVPGRYPTPADSLLMRNEGGRFVVAQRFEKFGLVSGAVFSDLDGDGKPDLVLACDWGPVRILRNQQGKLTPWDVPLVWTGPRSFDGALTTPNAQRSTLNAQPATLNRLTGWWKGVATGDFDGDGRLDIVAGNWGLNSHYRTTAEHPRRVYHGDLDHDLIYDIVEAIYDPVSRREVPDRSLKVVGAALPWVREATPTYEAYAKASLAEIYGERLQAAGAVEVTTLASMVFLNRGDHFDARELPPEAQWTPAFGLCVGDFDGDGCEDVFLSQNFFAVAPDGGRQDAGRGLWLRGDGRGGFTAVPGQESGVRVYGEQRGCALGDFDRDGRVDLAVTQNGAATRLFHNVRARPGLRVRLEGPSGNRLAFGATLRLGSGDRLGPAREIHGGSGYWSQDSAVQVLGSVPAPDHLQVRWPDGKTTLSAVPAGAREVRLNAVGELKVTP